MSNKFSEKILLCAYKDWANLGFTLASALRGIGLNAEMVKMHPHMNAYMEEGAVLTEKQIYNKIKHASIVHFMHSLGYPTGVRWRRWNSKGRNISLEDAFKKDESIPVKAWRMGLLEGKKVVMFHGGTEYRQHHDYVNFVANKFVDRSIVQTYDLLDLGAKNESWVLAPVNVGLLPKFDLQSKKSIVFAHYPSNPIVKNSNMINGVMERCEKEVLSDAGFKRSIFYKYSDKRESHYKNMLRVRTCDVYIDHQGFLQNGKKYGEFGIATLEAAALGKIVITCTRSKHRYEKEYGEFLPFISNSSDDLKQIIMSIMRMSEKELIALKKDTYKWAKKNHSYKSIANRLKKIYQECLDE